MVAAKLKFSYLADGSLDSQAWLNTVKDSYSLNDVELLQQTITFVCVHLQGLTTFYGQTCIEHGLEIADIILNLGLDQETASAGILVSVLNYTRLDLMQLAVTFKTDIIKLLQGIAVINAIPQLQSFNLSRKADQADKTRKMLLAMATDIRVVLLKLAERLSIMRGIKNISWQERKYLAEETLAIYSPLANRLGIGQIKWELEDYAFHYSNPDAYKVIARYLAERRSAREQRIDTAVELLKNNLAAAKLDGKVYGRAKHIYSIYLKTQHKQLDFKDIYDQNALRILVPTIADCYMALSIVHKLWEQIPQEYDDYIAHPKPNGYRSIHTAVIGPQGKYLEVQIRTTTMHQEAERGIAAHWIYKENTSQATTHEAKINYLRQLLDWHKNLTPANQQPSKDYFDNDTYVFTPQGDIIILPTGATPIDFAYHVHSSLGHRCRGAKVNGAIVPLTYQLATGDHIEILTIRTGGPSRDWLNSDLKFISTSRAKAKISQWFRQQSLAEDIEQGQEHLAKELIKAGLPSAADLWKKFNFTSETAFFMAIARGSLKIAHIINILQQEQKQNSNPRITTTRKAITKANAGFVASGITGLLTRLAQCCKPIPGDAITGYITLGRGITIHRTTCLTLLRTDKEQAKRVITVDWDDKVFGPYYVDLQIHAYIAADLTKNITAWLTNHRISLKALVINTLKNSNGVMINITIAVQNLNELKHIENQLLQLPHIHRVHRAYL